MPWPCPFPPGRGCGLLAALALLAGCAGASPDDLPAEALAAALASNRASLEALNPDGTVPAALAGGARSVPAGGRAPRGTAEMVGATAGAVTAWLGPPQLRRVEGDAEIWRYRGANCHLDLVLYQEAGTLRVGFATARAAGLDRQTEGDCLQGLARRAG